MEAKICKKIFFILPKGVNLAVSGNLEISENKGLLQDFGNYFQKNEF